MTVNDAITRLQALAAEGLGNAPLVADKYSDFSDVTEFEPFELWSKPGDGWHYRTVYNMPRNLHARKVKRTVVYVGVPG